jgi:hypothetical protein
MRTKTEEEVLLSESSDMPEINETGDKFTRDDSYVSPPKVSKSTILLLGFFLFGLALVWPPLILLFTYLASVIIPYSYRDNDDPSTRRQLLLKFEKEDRASDGLRKLPDDVCLEDDYWVNKR